MNMMKKIVMMSGILLSAQAYGKVITIASPADFDKEIKSGIVVVKFFAPWCSACKSMKNPYESISKEYPGVKFLEVDVDTVKSVADDHDVRSLPTFKYFVNGKEQRGMTHFGGGSASEIKNKINSLSQGKNSVASKSTQPKTKQVQVDRSRECEMLRIFNSKSQEEQDKIIASLQASQEKTKKTVMNRITGSAKYAGTKIKDGFSWTKNKIKGIVS